MTVITLLAGFLYYYQNFMDFINACTSSYFYKNMYYIRVTFTRGKSYAIKIFMIRHTELPYEEFQNKKNIPLVK